MDTLEQTIEPSQISDTLDAIDTDSESDCVSHSDTSANVEKPVNRRGRPPGVGNLVPRELKAMIELALHHAGGEAYLLEQARDNPTAFMALVGKLIPRDMTIKAELNVHVRHELIEKAVALLTQRAPVVKVLPPPKPHVSAHY